MVTVDEVVLNPELAEPKFTSSMLVMVVLAPALEPVASVLQKVLVPHVPVGKAVNPGVTPSASQKKVAAWAEGMIPTHPKSKTPTGGSQRNIELKYLFMALA